MKRVSKILSMILSVLLVLSCVSFSAIAEQSTNYQDGDYMYVRLDDGTAQITEYIGSDSAITVPSKIDNYVVSSVGEFSNELEKTSVLSPLPYISFSDNATILISLVSRFLAHK